MSISTNLARVQERLAAAARRASRNPSEIVLMGVSKTVAPEAIREAYAAGLRVFGESRVQEFSAKINALNDLSGVSWHMIGHLQSNKAVKAVELFSAVDSVDSLRLAEKLDVVARQLGKRPPILIEINTGGEPAKSGIAPQSPELDELLEHAAQFTNLHIRGLMTVPPYAEDPEQARPYFRQLAQLRDRLAARYANLSMDVLSVGMSHDFEVAIEEGATCVRIGTAIFGERV